MKFGSARDLLDTYIYVATSEGGPRGITDCICAKFAAEKGRKDGGDVGPDWLTVRQVYTDLPTGEFMLPYHEVDFSAEQIIVFKVDVDNILARHFNERERFALLVYGMLGMCHGANALRTSGNYVDVGHYVSALADKASPHPGEWTRLQMQYVIARLEDFLVAGDYLRPEGRIALLRAVAARLTPVSGSKSLLGAEVA